MKINTRLIVRLIRVQTTTTTIPGIILVQDERGQNFVKNIV